MRIVELEKLRTWSGQVKRTLNGALDLRRRGHDVLLVCRPESELRKRAEAAGLPVMPLPMKGWRFYPSVLRLARRLRGEPPDVLHAHGSRDMLMAIAASRLSNGAPVVRTKHNVTPITGRVIYRRMVTLHVGLSQAAVNTLLEAGVPAERTRLVYDAVDIQEYFPRPKDPSLLAQFGIRPDEFVIGMTGRLGSPRKNVPTFLRAAASVRAKAPRVRFLLVGGDRDEVRAMAAPYGLGESLVAAGWRNDIPAMLALMDVYAMPSLREAMGNAALEAMAMGKAVIASNVDGLPEFVVEGETGRLCPPTDADAFARAMLDLINDPPALERMGRKARRKIEEEFTDDKMFDGIEAALREAATMSRRT